MPFSDSRLNDVIELTIKRLNPQTILDLGCGNGKYARIARKVAKPHIVGIEIDQSYIKEFDLSKYDRIFNLSIQDYIKQCYEKPEETEFDLVIMGDVIEHLKKSEGIDAINYFIYRCKHLLIVFPEGVVLGAWEGHIHEKHISVWGKPDLINYSFEWHEEDFMRLALINGYLQ